MADEKIKDDAGESVPPAPEIMSIPVKMTPKQINTKNREYWGQTVGDKPD